MGCMDRALLEAMLSQNHSLAEIGKQVGLHEATVGYWVKKYDLKAVHKTRHAARGTMLRRLGRRDAAQAAFARAAHLAATEADRRFLAQQLQELAKT